jgi:uncharacterized protein (UPF0212 family)
MARPLPPQTWATKVITSLEKYPIRIDTAKHLQEMIDNTIKDAVEECLKRLNEGHDSKYNDVDIISVNICPVQGKASSAIIVNVLAEGVS